MPESPPDYLSEDDLHDLELDPNDVRWLCPWAVELIGLDGQRCWIVADLVSLEHGGRP